MTVSKIVTHAPAKSASTSRGLEALGKGPLPQESKSSFSLSRNKDWKAVVAIGASAGGLEALCEFFQNIAQDHLTFVVLQHLSPNSQSLLPLLLQRISKLQVIEAFDGAELVANIVYVVPPNTDIAVTNGRLSVWHRQDRRNHVFPIDFFFRSLAQDQGSRTVGVILSGTGTDGTEGLKAIQNAGGLTFAQDASARFNGMPRHAVESKCADYCLNPSKIAFKLQTHSETLPKQKCSMSPHETWLDVLVLKIKTVSGLDFRLYKPSTLIRRVERRSSLRKYSSLQAYVSAATSDEDELKILSNDLLINVTRFFRDKEYYNFLRSTIVPELCATAEAQNLSVRVWVAACATGEEAYSVAILFLEFLEETGMALTLQIFATDLSKSSIDVARRGCYPLHIADDIRADMLTKYFSLHNRLYRVRPRLRSVVVFSQHNILSDPPFSRMSLITCRNLLIYMIAKAQKQIFNRLHYALARTGYLALGTSESASEAKELFCSRELRHKIYAKQQIQRPKLDAFFLSTAERRRSVHEAKDDPVQDADHGTKLDNLIVTSSGIVAFVVDEKNDILDLRGEAVDIVRLRPGQVRLHLSSITSSILQRDVQCSVDNCRIREGHISGKDTTPQPSGVTVVPIFSSDYPQGCVLVIVDEKARLPELTKSSLPAKSKKMSKTDILKALHLADKMCDSLRCNLDSVLAQKATLNRALAAARQDAQAKLEELQSTVEELETSREEMQSANEEISVVNDELRMRMEDNEAHQQDLSNLLASVDEGLLLLDEANKLRRYSEAARRDFNLTPRDIGSTIGHIRQGFPHINFDDEIIKAHQSRHQFRTTLKWNDNAIFSVRIQPVSYDNRSRGTLISLSAILSDSSSTLDANHAFNIAHAEANWGRSACGLIAFSENLDIFWANRAACFIFSTSLNELVKQQWASLTVDGSLQRTAVQLSKQLVGLRYETDPIEIQAKTTKSAHQKLQVQMHRRFLRTGSCFLTLSAKEN